MKENVRILVIGFKEDGWATDSKATEAQIREVEQLQCALQHQGRQVTWLQLDNPDEPRTLFQFILADRRVRVDQNTAMADRPPCAAVTIMGNRVVRLEMYEGHDALALSYDFRAPELEGRDLPRWMERDPQAYDPVKFLQEFMGSPGELAEPLLEEAHKEPPKADLSAYVHKILKVDGTLVDCPPKGKQYTLEELQAVVGGFIQIVHPAGDGRHLIVLNEEGKVKDLPLNKTATRLYHQPPDYIVGDVLVCLDGDID